MRFLQCILANGLSLQRNRTANTQLSTFTLNWLIPTEVADFGANRAQTTNLAWHMRSKEWGQERERQRNRARENKASIQGAAQYSSLRQRPRWSVLIMDCIGSVTRGMTMSLFLTQKKLHCLYLNWLKADLDANAHSIMHTWPVAPSKRALVKAPELMQTANLNLSSRPREMLWVCSNRAWTNSIKKDNLFPRHVTHKRCRNNTNLVFSKSFPSITPFFSSPEPFFGLSLPSCAPSPLLCELWM